MWGRKISSRTPSALWFRNVGLCFRLPARQSVAFSNRLNVIARLSVGWDVATILEHRAFARIITRQHQIDFPSKHVHQLLHVLGAASDVFSRVERLANT